MLGLKKQSKEEIREAFMSNRQLNLLFRVIKTMMAVLIALTMAFVVILLVSEQPWDAITGFIGGPFTSVRRFG